jgi:Tol biopolymer transport system component
MCYLYLEKCKNEKSVMRAERDKRWDYVMMLLVLVLWALLILFGCDTCRYDEVYYGQPGDIFFTALPVNSTEPSIFQITLDNKNPQEIIKNGILYSAPSRNGLMVFIRNYPQGSQDVILCNINGSGQRAIASSYIWQSRNSAIISSNGNNIAIVANENELWLVRNETRFYKLSNSFCKGTLPSFSPDGTKIAFFEGKDIYSAVGLAVYYADADPPVELNRKPLNGQLIEVFGEPTIVWSEDGQYLIYPLETENEPDYLYIVSYNGSSEKTYEFGTTGCAYAIPNKDLTKVYLTGKDGILWSFSFGELGQRYKAVSQSFGSSFNVFQNLSNDGKNIIYTRYYRDDLNIFRGTLELVSLTDDTPHPKILGSNVYRAFWFRR